jgi:hypothetical protein
METESKTGVEIANALSAGSNRQQQAGPCRICPITRTPFSMLNHQQPIELPCCSGCVSTAGLKQVRKLLCLSERRI